jgi:NH3-dependent NAD+ synthetase
MKFLSPNIENKVGFVSGTCDSSPCITTCKIKTDKNNTCKTCGMLITSPEFTSNLTGKTYYTKSFDPLDCSTKNVIYGI